MNVFRIPEFLSEKESAICYERVLEIEDELMALGEHNYPSVKGDKLTGRYQYYNASDQSSFLSILFYLVEVSGYKHGLMLSEKVIVLNHTSILIEEILYK